MTAATSPRRAWVLLLALFMLLTASPPSMAQQDMTPEAQALLMAHVRKFRLVGGVDAARIPGFFPLPSASGSAFDPALPGITGSDARQAVWALFFRGTQIHMAHLSAPTKLVAFYHPVVDAWLLTSWNTATSPARMARAEIVLGDTLRGEKPLAVSPAWSRGQNKNTVLEAIPDQVSRTMAAFKKAYPAQSAQPPKLASAGMGSAQTLEIFSNRLTQAFAAVASAMTTPEVSQPYSRFTRLLSAGDTTGLSRMFPDEGLGGSIQYAAAIAAPFRTDLLPVLALETQARVVVASANPEQGRIWFLVSFRKTTEGRLEPEGLTALDIYRRAP